MPSIEDKDYANMIEKALKALDENYRIGTLNREKIKEYIRYLAANGYSKSRIYKNLLYLPRIAEHMDNALEYATKRDIEDVMIWINNLDSSYNTKRDYVIILKRFYRWIGGGDYPEYIRWVTTGKKKGKEVLPEELLTEDDIIQLIDAADNPRDRALIAVLWETGARVGEIIDLKIRSFEDHKHGMKIVVKGKTGSRRLPLILSVPYIVEWIAVHPHKKDRDAPMWINIGNVHKGEAMKYHAINKMLRETAKKAGIDKPVNPHHFRHSRATYMAKKFSEAQLSVWFGWVQSSDSPRTYVHLSGKDIDADYARLYGIEDPEEPKISKMTPKTCPRCGVSVERDAKFCHRCGMVLDMDTAVKMDEMEETVTEAFVNLNDPDVRKAFEMVSRMYELMKKDADVAKAFEKERNGV